MNDAHFGHTVCAALSLLDEKHNGNPQVVNKTCYYVFLTYMLLSSGCLIRFSIFGCTVINLLFCYSDICIVIFLQRSQLQQIGGKSSRFRWSNKVGIHVSFTIKPLT
jgi:hypothetical protein